MTSTFKWFAGALASAAAITATLLAGILWDAPSRNKKPRIEAASTEPEIEPSPAARPAASVVPSGCSETLIDNFELKPEAGIPTCQGRAGRWYPFNDQDPGTEQVPRPGARFLYEAVEQGSALRTHGRCQASAPSDSRWCAGIGVDLNNRSGNASDKRPYSAAARGYTGIRFRARLGPTAVSNEVTLRFPDIHTEPTVGKCNRCFDDYLIELQLKPTWEVYTVHWSDLRHLGSTSGDFAQDAIIAIYWRFHPGATFDLYLDDVEFIR